MNEASTGRPASGAQQPPPTPPILRRFLGAIDSFTDWTGWLIAFLLVPLMITVVAEVFGRYMMGRSLFWSYDVIYMLYGSLFMLGAAYTLLHKGHIRSDFIYVSLPVRWQGLIDTVAYVGFFFPVMFFLLWYGWDNFQDAVRLNERSIHSAWGPVLYPFRAVIPLAALMLLVQGLSETTKSLHALITGRWP
ncbi:TRAP-type mannitol/chloroaromatic compound transport system permease small subunit [Natronocella acetinitrilica]|uniref:TRAP transporter small permease protein n=1 Tax=Natronocella acetinitrilica TaxID=414046 RepID=A0AAE3G2I4_9GAMM|nr:TRAP transporter small permease subunit [Natronocella acetinitrilica]MCP1673526.1 TRAP-type mannitol/chloroaromatic compound transport system permease small subunit [Natronocella acetinitrilica]